MVAKQTERGQQVELKRLLDDAFRAFEAGDDDTARRLCREALAIDPDSSTAHSLMGLLYEREGLTGEATDAFQRVVTLAPESEAERGTLRRLRGDREPVSPEDEASARGNKVIVGVAVVAGLVVFLSVFLGIRMAFRWVNDKAAGSTIVASANVDEDLALAKEAFDAGRYQTALEAAQRVLKADPDNPVAQEIVRRAQAYLRGGAAAAPATPREQAQGQPAVPRNSTSPAPVAPGAPAATVAPAPVPGVPAPANVPPAPAVGGNLPPATVTPRSLPAVSPPYTRPLMTPTPSPGYDTTGWQRYRSRAATVRPQVPVRPRYEDPAPQPSGEPANGVATVGGGGQPRPQIKVEVSPRQPQRSDQPGPEVAPDTDPKTPPAATTETDGKAKDPKAAEYQEKQRKLREAKARQKAAEKRRAEREQGK